jgi:hypothetical protein
MILYNFCLLAAQFCDEVINIRNFERHMHIAYRCAPWTVASGVENLVLKAAQF